MFGPLVSAASVLVDCFDTIEVAARNQQDYEHLATELDTLAKSLVTTCKGGAPSSVTDCVKGIGIVIKREAEEIENKVGRGTGRRMVMANADGEDLVRRYRRIESLFRQLQTNIGTSAWAIANELMVQPTTPCCPPRPTGGPAPKAHESASSPSSTLGVCPGPKGGVLDERNGRHWQDHHRMHLCQMARDRETPSSELLLHKDVCRLPRRNSDRTDSSIPTRTVLHPIPVGAVRRSRERPGLGNEGHQDAVRTAVSRPTEDNQERHTEQPGGGDRCAGRVQRPTRSRASARHAVQARQPAANQVLRDESTRGGDLYDNDDPCTVAGGDIPTRHRKVAGQGGHRAIPKAGAFVYDPRAIGSSAQAARGPIRGAVHLCGYACSLHSTRDRKANSRERLNTVLGMTAESGQENSKIDELYMAILKSALDGEELEASEKEAAQAVLRTVLFAQGPISLETIGALSGINNTHRVECALNGLRSVLHTRGLQTL
ncbi:hypothetical protein RHS01_11190 [Rhizoctonia solani]|uniref:Uncharacterized protein n=1 Tax=Rhizoctonia solani TaxID=456999 RepID=A0A8H7I5F5_9AGAM|nr:hypothetical protein RHS01_11190 [Rhizoctonia solani]